MTENIRANEEFRRVLATANKLESIQSNLDSVIDFFLAPIVSLYSKLCNDCLKLLFECEFKLDHFRKAEDLVWRRIYHDIYRFQKTKRLRFKKQDEFLLESHFISGIGFYSSLIVKLRSHYRIHDIPGLISPLNLSLGPLDNFVANQPLNWEDKKLPIRHDDPAGHTDKSTSSDKDIDAIDERAKEWAHQAIYRSLVYMGDLARYLLETSQFDYRRPAFEFYRSASRNQPQHGLPFNQLATLAGGMNHNLDAVCNYMRCCLKLKPFEGAEGNMKKLFELNNNSYDELKNRRSAISISDVLASKEPVLAAESLMKSIIVTFIKLTSSLWVAMSEGGGSMKSEIAEITRIFFESLREALELEPIVPLAGSKSFEQHFCPISGGSSSLEKPKYVTPTIMYEFGSIAVMLISKCQKRKPPTSEAKFISSDFIMDLVNTLALNLLHYSTSKCQKMITRKVQELRLGCRDLMQIGRSGPADGSSSKLSLKNSSLSNSQRSIELAADRRTLSRIRQKRAAAKYSDQLNRFRTVSNQTDDSDMSELEETALSTIDALDISSDMSEEADYHIEDLIDLDSGSDDLPLGKHGQLSLAPGSRIRLSKPPLRPTRSQNYESEVSFNRTLFDSTSSLPAPDLVTGDINEKMNREKLDSSRSPMDSLCVSEDCGRSLFAEEIEDRTDQGSHKQTDLEQTLAFIYAQTYLPTVKVLFDWLLSNGDIINSNLQSFRSFHAELEGLILMLKELGKLTNRKDIGMTSDTTMVFEFSFATSNSDDQVNESLVYKHAFNGSAWIQKYPLSCDFPLFNLAALQNVHELNIDFNHEKELNDSEAGFVTIQCIEAFFHALTAFLGNKTFR